VRYKIPNGRKFTQEFKLEAAKLVKDTGKTVVKVAGDLGIASSVLGRWVKGYNAKELATPRQ
jgi:transposase